MAGVYFVLPEKGPRSETARGHTKSRPSYLKSAVSSTDKKMGLGQEGGGRREEIKWP
jgi:hypothetical protein